MNSRQVVISPVLPSPRLACKPAQDLDDIAQLSEAFKWAVLFVLVLVPVGTGTSLEQGKRPLPSEQLESLLRLVVPEGQPSGQEERPFSEEQIGETIARRTVGAPNGIAIWRDRHRHQVCIKTPEVSRAPQADSQQDDDAPNSTSLAVSCRTLTLRAKVIRGSASFP
jgi:hypothetical protein